MGTGVHCQDDISPVAPVPMIFILISLTDLTEPSSHLPLSKFRERKLNLYSCTGGALRSVMGAFDRRDTYTLGGRHWKLVFRLQAQVGAQSLYVKVAMSHGHGQALWGPW